MLIKKAYSDGLSAPKRTDHQESLTAIEEAGFATAGISHDFASIFSNRSAIIPAGYESVEKTHKI